MAELRTARGTWTQAQRQRIFGAAKRRGISHEQLREWAGVRSLADLSSARASALIERLTGRRLHHPPGRAPFKRHRATPGATLMITPDQVDQIERMGLSFFRGHLRSFDEWLAKNFKVADVRGLATALRGGQVIRVLREMLARPRGRPQGRRQAHQDAPGGRQEAAREA